MPPLKAILKTVLAAVGLLAAVAVALHFADYRLAVEPRYGRPTDTVMTYDPGADVPPRIADSAAPDPADGAGGSDGAEIRNLILLIGDGMGFGQVLGARAALAGMDGRLFMERLPVTGWLTTHSEGRLITDSGSGATSLATGYKTWMTWLSVSSDGQPRRTLMEAAKARGKAVGLLTDSYLWDATPAAFSVHLESRSDLEAVALQMAGSGFDLFLGESHRDLEEDDTDDGPVATAFRDRGFRVVRDAGALSAAPDHGPVLGLFAEGSVADADRAPHLPDLAAYAIDHLSRGGAGFALLIETEETDTGSHYHDFERVVRGIGALDRAVETAVEFARRDGRTLVIVTADHDTAGLVLRRGRAGRSLTVDWATTGHTGNPVPLFAYGPGAEAIGGVRDNTEVPRILARLLGLDL